MGAILMVTVQGHVSHVVYRVRQVSSSEHDGSLVDHDLDDRWRHLLCSDPGTRHQHHPESGQQQETIQREGDLTFLTF